MQSQVWILIAILISQTISQLKHTNTTAIPLLAGKRCSEFLFSRLGETRVLAWVFQDVLFTSNPEVWAGMVSGEGVWISGTAWMRNLGWAPKFELKIFVCHKAVVWDIWEPGSGRSFFCDTLTTNLSIQFLRWGKKASWWRNDFWKRRFIRFSIDIKKRSFSFTSCAWLQMLDTKQKWSTESIL